MYSGLKLTVMLGVENGTKINKKGLLYEVISNYEVSSSISFTTLCCFWFFQLTSNSVFSVISVQLFTFLTFLSPHALSSYLILCVITKLLPQIIS